MAPLHAAPIPLPLPTPATTAMGTMHTQRVLATTMTIAKPPEGATGTRHHDAAAATTTDAMTTMKDAIAIHATTAILRRHVLVAMAMSVATITTDATTTTEIEMHTHDVKVATTGEGTTRIEREETMTEREAKDENTTDMIGMYLLHGRKEEA
jgi:hypothetical protein